MTSRDPHPRCDSHQEGQVDNDASDRPDQRRRDRHSDQLLACARLSTDALRRSPVAQRTRELSTPRCYTPPRGSLAGRAAARPCRSVDERGGNFGRWAQTVRCAGGAGHCGRTSCEPRPTHRHRVDRSTEHGDEHVAGVCVRTAQAPPTSRPRHRALGRGLHPACIARRCRRRGLRAPRG